MYGADHIDALEILYSLARLYRLQQRYGDAELLYDRARTIVEKTYGQNHPTMADLLDQVGALYFEAGRGEDASRSFEDARKIRELVQ